MPAANNFRHQVYRSEPPTAPVEWLFATVPPGRDSDDYRRRMATVGRTLRVANVAAIYLVHGTFVGDDALGWFGELARFWPTAAELLREQHKQALDAVLSDVGNYTAAFATEFENAIHADSPLGARKIPVRLFYWSGENNHIARADGAVRLLDKLVADYATAEFAETSSSGRPRVLLWGHSHAGNVFALLTNLLGCDSPVREKFFEAASPFYRVPLLGATDVAVWKRVENLLRQTTRSFVPALDMVTFGTPICYGWETTGYEKLLHFVFHRPTENHPAHLAVFPPRIDDMRHARGGDYVQQFGIAGTNFLPNLLSWRSQMAEFRLNQFLQPGLKLTELLSRLKVGTRVADEGRSLLVDYGPVTGSIYEHILGHAIYTRLAWLLFHAEETVRRFYEPVGCAER